MDNSDVFHDLRGDVQQNIYLPMIKRDIKSAACYTSLCYNLAVLLGIASKIIVVSGTIVLALNLSTKVPIILNSLASAIWMFEFAAYKFSSKRASQLTELLKLIGLDYKVPDLAGDALNSLQRQSRKGSKEPNDEKTPQNSQPLHVQPAPVPLSVAVAVPVPPPLSLKPAQ